MNSKIKISFLLISLVLFQVGGSTVFAKEAGKKVKPKLRLSYVKEMNKSTKIVASAYYKVGNDIIPCDSAIIGFYKAEDGEGLFEKIPTDNLGKAVLSLNSKQLDVFKDSTGLFHFFVQVEPSDKYKLKATDLEISDANLDVKFIEGDSTNYIEALLTKVTDSLPLPLEKMPIKFMVKRALSMLSIGDKINYTNSKGIVRVEFPNDLPGTHDGTVNVVVLLEEDDNYGTVKYNEDINWGVPLAEHEEHSERKKLYGGRNNAPLFIVVGVNIVLIVIWGYMAYIVFGLIKIKRLGKQEA